MLPAGYLLVSQLWPSLPHLCGIPDQPPASHWRSVGYLCERPRNLSLPECQLGCCSFLHLPCVRLSVLTLLGLLDFDSALHFWILRSPVANRLFCVYPINPITCYIWCWDGLMLCSSAWNKAVLSKLRVAPGFHSEPWCVRLTWRGLLHVFYLGLWQKDFLPYYSVYYWMPSCSLGLSVCGHIFF